jgi:polyphenol oxidase
VNPDWLIPDWPAPANVRAFATTRAGGVSKGAYASMNLGTRSGDDPANVMRNRLIVHEHLPQMPGWLAQCHGVDVVDLDGESAADRPADAAVATKAERVCSVLTADCLPVLLCKANGTSVGIAHAGWRGMAAGVIENTVAALRADRGDVIAWLGPAIGPDAFEVGPEVRAAFMAVDAAADSAFRVHREGKYMADLYALARQRLARAGVTRVFGGGFCTLHESERFFSYRREKQSGRMGSFIWIAN